MDNIFILLVLSLPTCASNGYGVYQTLVQCELLNTQSGKMIIKDAAGGFTTDELTYINNNFTYFVNKSHSQELLKPHLDKFKDNVKNIYYPTCIKTLENYLKTRADQIRSLKKPNVKFVRKANTASGSFQAICLATGFYPRHINLTLFRDGQPVSDDKITGVDLLPNDDGTYQMRKILEISEEEKKEKHKYTVAVLARFTPWANHPLAAPRKKKNYPQTPPPTCIILLYIILNTKR
ncbi:major histocompatibility complex class I-related gene protein [Misgurnus anguillicaudatus]|uniref:major histocompatibility complex class I-related gene protein n=1 Tax=Misgurnus anguillicaudatus TaxID=75329 RepID=UPI003CCF1E22